MSSLPNPLWSSFLSASTTYATTSPALTEDDVRRIVREELRAELDRRDILREYDRLTRGRR